MQPLLPVLISLEHRGEIEWRLTVLQLPSAELILTAQATITAISSTNASLPPTAQSRVPRRACRS